MPTLAEASKSILPGWGYYTGAEVDSANTQNPYGQQFLADVQKYDPNARWEFANAYGGSDGGAQQTMYKLNYDASKLPGGGTPGMVDMNAGAFNGMYNDGGEHSYKGNLFNPDAVGEDKNGYGRTTSPRNMNLGADHHSAVDTYGPMIIALIASLGAAAPALMAGNASLGSFSTGLGGSLTNGIVGGARSLGNGGGAMSLLPMLAQLGGSFAGVSPSLTGGAVSLAQLAQQHNRGQQPPGG